MTQTSAIHVHERLPIAVILVLSTTLLLASCNRDPDCQRCEYVFTWDSNRHLDEVAENCVEIDCDIAQCGSCFDIEYNRSGLPASGTCDSCQSDRARCEAGEMFCQSVSRCVDVYTDPDHCGECDIPCAEGQECRDGQCI